MMATALLSAATFASTTDSYQASQTSQDFKRLSGALHVGAGTAYTLHGYVVSRPAVQGEGYGMGAVQIAYDFGRESFWSYAGGISYKCPFSGHTLYGQPTMSRDQFATQMPRTTFAQLASAQKGIPSTLTAAWANGQLPAGYAQIGAALDAAYEEAYQKNKKMPYKNIEDEFIIRNSVKYTRPLWNVAFGHDFIHGGIPGVVAKHFDGNDESRMQQFFTNFEVTPVAWFSADLNVARTFDTINGWWFEAHARFKAPLIGTPEDIILAGILEYGMSWTANFYNSNHNACSNGTQAFWLKFATPWFATEDKSFIITPAVSFNWLGKGGMKANERSHAKVFGNQYKPFRNFAVVGDLTVTYKF